MLKDYRLLAVKLKEKFGSIDHWNDVKFNDQDKEKIGSIDSVTFVNDYSVQLKSEGGNHIIIPSQYILYVVCLKEFACQVYDYMQMFDQLKGSENQSSLAGKIRTKSLTYNNVSIDEYSKEIGPSIFWDSSLNLGAKDIVNSKNNDLKLRGTSDFFGSIILKPINIPNASSSILGKFIYNLCGKQDVYKYLENRFIANIPFIVKDKVIKDFCYQTVSFLYSYDKLARLEGKIIKNPDIKFSSIKENGTSLTSIFRTSSIPLESVDLEQGSKLRFFEEPLFYLNKEYYYLSTEWTNDGKSRLDLSNFKKVIESYYPEFRVEEKESTFYLLSANSLDANDKGVVAGSVEGYNKIYFGAPGTGKSYAVTQLLKKKEVPENRIERVTFHPDYDYSSFVGGYKPVSELNDKGEEVIKYKFVPQVFTNIYVKAHQDPERNYYLIIEEINRGNCAEIFGDIFQLLDRNPDYAISPSEELRKHLIAKDNNSEHKTSVNEKMTLPNNLIILATMNTSDQSLYPMDSAFKRRWNWEYVPIHFPKGKEDTSCPSYGFQIRIDDENSLSWIDFVARINSHIVGNPSLGMDKCLGNFFIKPTSENQITSEEFINKVMFYLWNDVFKDEDNKVFQEQSYLDYFPIETNGVKRLYELIEKLELQDSLVNQLEDDTDTEDEESHEMVDVEEPS